MRVCILFLICLAIVNTGKAQVNLGSGLVAYYPFNGNANDASGNNHHGQLQNGLQLTTDRFGNTNSAYLFDGVNDYIKVLDNGSFSTPRFSLVVWFQSHSDALQNLVGKRDFTTVGGAGGAQYQFFINYQPFPGIGSNLVGNNSSCTNIGPTSYINTNDWICRTKWYCAVITFDGSRHKIYIDGVLKRDESTSFSSFLQCSSDLRFGNWWQGDLLPFKGIMDDIRWYNRALSQDEVTALYANFPNISGQCGIAAGAGFLAPDTVCVNTPVEIRNTSVGASSYFWNFCVANSATNPTGTNLGNGGYTLPVFTDYAKDGSNYYAFITNNMPGKLIRLDFGNSLLNTPVSHDFGNLGGVIPDQCEGIQIVKNQGRWYAIIVGGQPTGRIVKVDFGPSLSNSFPTATNWGDIGNLAYPTDLHVFQSGNTWYGLTINAQTNTITRFNFTNSFNNVPSGVNLGNIGGLNYPTGIHAISKDNNWYAFISNAGNGLSNSTDASLTRLNFGNSLLNTPTGVNLGNPGNALSSTRDLTIYQSCNEIFGFAVNNASAKEIVRLNFNNDLTAIPSTNVLGNTGNLAFPHSISKLFREGSDLYAFIANVDNNSLTRLRLSGCNNSSIANSTSQNPAAITYNTPGNYTINLTIDDGLPTQSAYCKPIIVVDNTHTPIQNKSICEGDSILLTSSKPSGNLWSTGSNSNSIFVKTAGIYWVQSSMGGCINIDSFSVTVTPSLIVDIGVDTLLCSADSLLLNAGNFGANYLWQDGQTTQSIIAGQGGLYYVHVSKDGCLIKDSILITELPSPNLVVSDDTMICGKGPVVLSATGGDRYQWTPVIGISDPTSSSIVANPDSTTKYYITATGNNNCSLRDSVTITVIPKPVVSLGDDTTICSKDSLLLDAGNLGATFLWQSGDINQTLIVKDSGLYHVTVNVQGCIAKDSISIALKLSPVLTISSDTTICKMGSATLTAHGGTSYNWSPSTGISDSTNSQVNASPDTTTRYYVTVVNDNNCTAKDSILLSVIPKPFFSASSSKEVLCFGDTAVLSAFGGDNYSWSPSISLDNPGANTTSAFPLVGTNYKVVIRENRCRITDSLFIRLPVAAKPITSTNKSNDLNCFQAQARLMASGGAKYLWRPSTGLSDSTSQNPFVSIGKSTTYLVTVTSAEGCQVQDSVLVLVNKGNDGSGFPVPSAFTPNADGKNDCFGVQYWGNVSDFSLSLYNRWGEVVFQANNPTRCWNGMFRGVLQPSDIYVYIVKAKTICGEVFRKGTFALIR